MSITLANYEKGGGFDGDYVEALKLLQRRLSLAHARHIVHGHRAIIVMEGWDAAGKGGIIKRMTAEWDPRYFHVWPISAPTPYEKDRHFLWRFWQKLPGSREVCVFDRSWYGRVLVERVEGFCSERDWKRGYDEINEFEAQQVDGGTAVIKLFLHVTQTTQDKRLADRLSVPEKRWKVTADDFRNRARRDDYLEAMQAMFKQTDTRWAPWAVFDGNNKKAARIAAMTHVAERLEASVPKDLPEADPALVEMAREAFGYKG
ncbi:polyphosphate kinase 2 family protein [Blastomonas sp.]|uniref:polyphosphate kinase 2 family protein n=1 Tax=Blastomonas sp. TaxID=1909299 RepID=UPI0035939048